MRYTMKYDFTTILDRKGKDAIALDALGVKDVYKRQIYFSVTDHKPAFPVQEVLHL